VVTAHRRLLARAVAMGWLLDGDPELRVLADGAALTLDRRGRTSLPPGARELRLESRRFVPRWLGLADDGRCLGVAVASLRMDGRRPPASAFADGWHAPEPGWRWTDGAAILELLRQRRAITFSLRLADMGERYWRPPATARTATESKRPTEASSSAIR
jgi:hypothetical protein